MGALTKGGQLYRHLAPPSAMGKLFEVTVSAISVELQQLEGPLGVGSQEGVPLATPADAAHKLVRVHGKLLPFLRQQAEYVSVSECSVRQYASRGIERTTTKPLQTQLREQP